MERLTHRTRAGVHESYIAIHSVIGKEKRGWNIFYSNLTLDKNGKLIYARKGKGDAWRGMDTGKNGTQIYKENSSLGSKSGSGGD